MSYASFGFRPRRSKPADAFRTPHMQVAFPHSEVRDWIKANDREHSTSLLNVTPLAGNINQGFGSGVLRVRRFKRTNAQLAGCSL